MKRLSPKDLARALGVSESSVKRWVDDGALRAMRTAGGHRRIALAEAVRFVRESGAPLVRPEVIVGAGLATPVSPFDATAARAMGEQLYGLLEEDDAAAVRALVLALYVAGWPVADICDGPMRAALEKIGTLWQHGPEGIVVEHRATDTCVRALSEMRTAFVAPAGGASAALGAAPSGDPYLVPSMMAAAVLADLGYRDHNLGPEVPVPALEQAIERYRPTIVWLALSVVGEDAELAPGVAAVGERLARRGATLVVGGRGSAALVATAGVLKMHSMAELAAFARGVRTVSRVS
jgi:excisionase family DNA binding protein